MEVRRGVTPPRAGEEPATAVRDPHGQRGEADDMGVEPGAQPYSPGADGLPRMWLTHTALGLQRVDVPVEETGASGQKAGDDRRYSPDEDGLPRLWLTETALQLERVDASGPAGALAEPDVAAAVRAAKRKTRLRVRKRGWPPILAAFLAGATLATVLTYLVMR